MSKNDSLKAKELEHITGGTDGEEKPYVPNWVNGVDLNSCFCCGECTQVCPVECISLNGSNAVIDLGSCVYCEVCTATCPSGAIDPSMA